MAKIIIFAGAHIADYTWLKSQITLDDTLICADSGARHAHAIGIIPDLIIGDFDSIDATLLTYYTDKTDIIRDIDQNTTDLMKALSHADKNAPIDIYGAVGERADHDFSNYLILMNMDAPDTISLRTQNETRRIIKSSITFNGTQGDHIGIFPLSPVNDLSTKGLKYTPDVLGAPYDFGWNGACNEMIADKVSIMFNNGTILVTHTFSK